MYQHASMDGKIAVVTGGGQGIGEATCLALAASGARVLAIDISAEGLERLAIENPGITPLVGDVSDEGLPDRIGGMLQDLGGDVDILVNNAGIGHSTHALATSDAQMQRYFDVNLMGAFRLSRWACGRMLARGAGGSIVNVSSVFGIVGAENQAGYAASKAAMNGLTVQMATDFGPSGIRVNCVAPGLIETPLTAERIRTQPWRSKILVDQAPIRRVGRVEDVARAIRFLASDEAAYITGLVLPVDGGWIVGRYPRETPLKI